MTTQQTNQSVGGPQQASRVPDFVDEAVGVGVVDGGTSSAPTYSVTMWSVAHPGMSWSKAGVVPFRTGGEKVACAASTGECIMRYYRHGDKEKYVAFEDALFYVCSTP